MTVTAVLPPRSLAVRRLRAAVWVLGLGAWMLHRAVLLAALIFLSGGALPPPSLLRSLGRLWDAVWDGVRARLFVAVVVGRTISSDDSGGSSESCSNTVSAAVEPLFHYDDKDCNHPNYWQYLLLFHLLGWLQMVLEDALAIAALLTAGRWLYLATSRTTSWRRTVPASAAHWAFEAVRAGVPAARHALDRRGGAAFAAAAAVTGPTKPSAAPLRQLPAAGRGRRSVLEELRARAEKEHASWRSGRQSGAVYYPPPPDGLPEDGSNNQHNGTDDGIDNNNTMSHSQFLSACYALYSEANPLHFGCWPKVNQCEAEVIAMTGHLLHCPTHTAAGSAGGSATETGQDGGGGACCGSLTSGGTESILLAVRAHRRHFGRHVRHPELVCGSTAHAAVRKACDLYGIRLVTVDCGGDDSDYRLTAARVKPYITSNTVLIYASAPCYPQGVVDDVVGLGALALRHNVGLHVDACLGGFVLPFLRDAAPPFDFSASEGVTSVSVDTHKYGMAAKGTSVVLYRQPELRHAQYFSYADWSGGLYATPTLAGSRPGGLSVAAWASLVSLGVEGYQRSADEIRTAVQIIVQGIASIGGLRVLGKQQYMVVCFGVDAEHDKDDLLDIYSIKDHMSEAHGWSLNDLQHPASVHLCVTLAVAPRARDFVQHLRQSVAHVRQETKLAAEQAQRDGSTKPPKKRGLAGIYGTAQSLPPGPVEYLLNTFLDGTLAP